MKTKNKISLGKLFLILGALLIIVGVGYEALSFPWSTLAGKVADPWDMKEPKPLSSAYFSYYENDGIEEELKALPAGNNSLPLSRPKADLTLMGSLKIPRMALSENIVSGVEDEILYAVGHAPSSALPGEMGNTVLAGHRNYLYMHPFKYLPKMQVDDIVQIEMNGKVYTYKVFEVFEVTPDEVWVAQPQEGHDTMLTLITCTPVPSYTKRLVVWADLTEVSDTGLLEAT